MTYKIAIGIDIGSDGAWAVFVNNKLTYGKMPYSSDEPDMRAFFELILDHVPQLNEDDELSMHIVYEDLHSVHGSSAKSNFSFGVNNGLVIAAVQISEIAYTKIQPKKWQKTMWEGIRPVEIPVPGKKNKDGSPKYKIDTKATSLVAARRLFPQESFLATERSKVPHNGIVDAVLIAEYCRRTFVR